MRSHFAKFAVAGLVVVGLLLAQAGSAAITNSQGQIVTISTNDQGQVLTSISDPNRPENVVAQYVPLYVDVRVDTNATTTTGNYTPRGLLDVLKGSAGSGTNRLWISLDGSTWTQWAP